MYNVRVISSLMGEASTVVEFPFDDFVLHEKLTEIEQILYRFHLITSESEMVVASFGKMLFSFLLHGGVGQGFRASLAYLRHRNMVLRLRLRIDDPKLFSLPWEFLCDPQDNQFLALSQHVSLIRHLPQAFLPHPLQKTAYPLQILGLSPTPYDLPQLNVNAEKLAIDRALNNLLAAGTVELTWIKGQTASDLQRSLRRTACHIFYFTGHGGFSHDRDEGTIMLADEHGQAKAMSSTQLARLLGDVSTLRLVVLNTDKGGYSSKVDIYSGMAATLIRHGIPAVLAMQYGITDRVGQIFAKEFYQSLAIGLPVEAAVTEGRKALYLADQSLAWSIPVLFTSSTHGVLFQLTEQELVESYNVTDPLVQSFLEKAGFTLEPIPQSNDIKAISALPQWRSRFSKGLYIRTLFNTVLDRKLVNSIYKEAQAYTDHALVIIDKTPELSAWMTIGGLRADDKSPFVLLPIDLSFLKEAVALGKESRTLHFYLDKHLGKGYNPYDVRDPVSDAISFFGREGLTDELSTILKVGHRVGLYGIHKMGKSSVLQRLRNKIEFPVAYIYLRKNDNLSGIYRRILDAWTLEMRVKYGYVIPPFPDDAIFTQVDFEKAAFGILNKVKEIGKEPQIAVFLDEIEAIVPFTVGDETTLNVYLTLMDCLRGLQHETGQLALLVAGIYPSLGRVNYFWGEQKNPMHQVITERFLPPMSAEDCEIMVRSLGEQIRVNYDQETVDYIFHASGGHPFLARQLCSLAVEQHNDSGQIPFSLIKQVTANFVRNPATTSYFDDQGLWSELGKAAIWGESVSPANHYLLRQLAANHPTGLTPDELQATAVYLPIEESLYALSERHVIKIHPETGRYVITFGLFADWIRRNK